MSTENEQATEAAQASTEDQARIDAEAAAEADKRNPAREVRNWLLGAADATLSSISVKRGIEGFPYGSVVPFATTREGWPVILTARIAAHTHNLKKNNKAALFVRQPAVDGDPQSGWRFAIMGAFERVVPEGADDTFGGPTVRMAAVDIEALHARYRQRVPAAEDYFRVHAFDYWVMRAPQKVRYIAGFGAITWLAGDDVLRGEDDAFAASAPGAIAHMNEDHAANLVELAHGFDPGLKAHLAALAEAGTPADETATMVSLDPAGFDVDMAGRRIHVPFGREITADEVRFAIIAALKDARRRA